MPVEITTPLENSDGCNREASDVDLDLIRANFNNLYGHSSEAVMLSDPFQPGQPIIACNEAFAHMNGYAPKELVNQYIDILHTVKRDLDVAMNSQLNYVNEIKRNGIVQSRGQHVRKDGQIIQIEFMVRLFSVDGRDFLLAVDKFLGLGEKAITPAEESVFLLLFKYSEAAVAIVEPLDKDWTILDCNNAYAQLLGFQREELIGQPLGNFSPEQDPEGYKAWMQKEMPGYINNLRSRGGEPQGGVQRCKDQTLCEVSYMMSLPVIEGREVLLVEIKNRTPILRARQLEVDRNRVLELIAQDEELSATLKQIASMCAAQIEPMECAILLNRDGVLYVGAAPHQSQEFHDFFSELPAEEAGPIGEAMQQRTPLFVSDSTSSDRWRNHRAMKVAKGAQCCWVLPFYVAGQLSGAMVLYGPKLQTPKFNELELLETALRLCAIAIERREQHERVAHQAQHDFLTGLPNRLLFEDRLNHALKTSQRRREQLALLFIDLDGFKQVNDTLGHEAGDLLLQQVAQRLQGAVRRSDTVGRLGGDEFTILLYDINYPEDIVNVSQKILEAVQAPMEVMAQDVFVTASIGVAVSPYHGSDSRTLMHNADAAMYRAKERGKNTYELFNDSAGQAVKQRLDLKRDAEPHFHLVKAVHI